MVMTQKKLQAQCDAWNKQRPVGTEVILTDDFGEKHLTKTRSEASLLGGHTPVVWTDLKPCYLLTRIEPRKCRVCGCTETTPCMTNSGPCYWVEPDLCSACAAGEAEDDQE